jgi:hypothetical protein
MIQPRTVVTWVMPILLGLAAIACMAQALVDQPGHQVCDLSVDNSV